MSAQPATERDGRAQGTRHRIVLAATLVALLVLVLKARSMLLAGVAMLGQMSWLALAALPVFCLWTMAASAGWRVLAIGSGVRALPSLARLCLIRVEAQAVNLVLPLAGVGGEALRAVALGRDTRQGNASTASVAADVTTEIIACFTFVAVALGLGWHSIRLGTGLRAACVAVSVAVALALYFLPPRLARLGQRLHDGRVAVWIGRACASVGSSRTSGWWRSVAWHLVERTLIAGETWVYAHALGFPISVGGALLATAMMTLLGCLMFFIPAQIGAADGGLALGLQWLGVPWPLALAVAFARRLRQLLVAFVGLALLGAGALGRRIETPMSESPVVTTAGTNAGQQEG